jgi:hypothetical protein
LLKLPAHLLELAESEARSPRQAVLRRAVSTAYYALFHELMGQTAKRFVPVAELHAKSSALFYRALEHGKTRERCKKIAQNELPGQERAFFGFDRFPDHLRVFAADFVRLQELRHKCDYDPLFKITKQEVAEAIAASRNAIERLAIEGHDQRLTELLAYLLVGLRG